MIWLYDLIIFLFILISLPVYLFRRKFHSGLLMRLGFFPGEIKKRLAGKRHLWVHAVSVGEVNAASHLIEKIHRQFPQLALVISTVTATGNRLAKSVAASNDTVIYLPLDLSFVIESVVRKINPSLFITTETEIWPNLITSLKKHRVPIVLVNGRISLGSFRGYRLAGFFLKGIFKSINLFCMQSRGDAKRITRLGADNDRVVTTGNLKFDLDLALDGSLPQDDYALGLKKVLGPAGHLIIAGSTHSGEEEIILGVYRQLLQQFGHLRLLIAPRHIERSAEIEQLCERNGFSSARLSKLNNEVPGADSVFILDSIGHLRWLYSLATIVFVGGSLIKKGGHNIIEPAFFGKPIIVGPYMFNFKDITRAFLDNQAVIKVSDELELLEELRILLLSAAKREELGLRCQETIKNNKGASQETFNLIEPLINSHK